MKAVILAGGLGTRLRPFTQVIPKPLLPIGEKAIIEIQILHLRDHGFKEVFIATNYKSDYIESFLADGKNLGVNIVVSKEEKPLGTCGPLSLLRDQLTEPFIVMNGDILTLLDFSQMYRTACASDAALTVVTTEVHTPFEFGKVLTDGCYITGVEEKPQIKIEIIAGIYAMKPSIFEQIPFNEYFGMDQLIRKLLVAQQPVVRYLSTEYWLDIGRVSDYEKAQRDYPAQLAS